ncbi:hypothetical protein EW146_g5774 [Bondarzewia mesenterica]|uniref:C3H1-type domain-containing protein n=1 Tax=Bondarzewia mesenterica TaxID=1095465 RepID=A0A4S4LSB7_9AGAM|nr:hypothetical protein EW146_g5774 [Bondarzewia mesenterica]
MPVADKNNDNDAYELEREKDRDRDRDREKGPKAKGSSKAKDLSHVPCKFFKVGSCTAGSSCPFSHSILEPGQQKDVCTWFVKGNCKFGHKCALAHVLPGQSMAMDRKNKKAAQAAANANGGAARDGGKPAKSNKGAQNGVGLSGNIGQRNPLLPGSTAPTRILQGSTRPPIPMSLKSAVSPSAPAPPLQDTDFASFGLPDETQQAPLRAPPKGSHSSSRTGTTTTEDEPTSASKSSPSPLPFSTPSGPRRQHGASPSTDLGPIGSPPRSVSSLSHPPLNGFSPGTSPAQNPNFISASPFSAPGTQTLFFAGESSEDFKARSGIAASLGTTRTPWRTDLSSMHSGSRLGGQDALAGEVVVEDEDLEDFIPSSLTDLLTPEERSRRYSRTNSANPGPPGMGLTPGREGWGAAAAGARPSVETHHHRYSHSVPAPSLLGDIKSIWADNSHVSIGSPRGADSLGGANIGGLGSGTPSSFKSNSGFGSRSVADDHISYFLSPSNASAAFLPGLNHHYLNSKGAAASRPTVGSLRPGLYGPNNAPAGGNAANLLARLNEPLSSSPQTGGGDRRHFDGTPSDTLGGQPFQLGRPIPGGNGGGFTADLERSALSPSTRALQSHAPGQSLPQGLAAGYSRIHALPPPPVIPSPSTSGTFASPQTSLFAPGTSVPGAGNSFSDWLGMSPGNSNFAEHFRGQQGPPGLESMLPRVAYGGAIPSRTPLSQGSLAQSAAPPGPTARTPSGRGWPHGVTPLSPLSGPVLTGDDDDLFSMDG